MPDGSIRKFEAKGGNANGAYCKETTIPDDVEVIGW